VAYTKDLPKSATALQLLCNVYAMVWKRIYSTRRVFLQLVCSGFAKRSQWFSQSTCQCARSCIAVTAPFAGEFSVNAQPSLCNLFAKVWNCISRVFLQIVCSVCAMRSQWISQSTCRCTRSCIAVIAPFAGVFTAIAQPSLCKLFAKVWNCICSELLQHESNIFALFTPKDFAAPDEYSCN